MWRYNNYHKHDHISNIYMSDSNVKAEQYIQRCIEYGHTNYFTTNHGSFGDIFEAKMLCNKYGIRCVAGIEGYIVPDPLQKDKSNYHIVIIPTTDRARKKMNRVSSRANIDGYYYRPRIFPEDLLKLDKEDIYITTACVAGIISDETSINQLFLPLFDHFQDHMLLEVQSHNDPLQIEINKRALEFSNKYGLRIIAANDSHYIDPEDQVERLELLKGKNISFGREDNFILDFPTAETMVERFKKQGVLTEQQIEEAINNTLIFDECEEIQLDTSIKMPTIYPNLTPKERVQLLKDEIEKRFKVICREEHIDYESFLKYREGIRYEMKIIEDTNDEIHTADYFLFNEKNVDLAVNKYGGVLTRGGRGSCASFYINRILGMTQLDRFKINLPIYPDRFASTARLLEQRSLPDIDFNCQAQEPFVQASRELLGEHGCYPMWAPGTLQESEAFRNVCRSKGMGFEEFNEVGKNLDSYREDPKWKPILQEAQKYIGTIVSGSVHPCAHLLSDKDIQEEYGVVRLGENICVLITSAEADAWKVLKNDYLIVKVWKLINETFTMIGKPIIPAHDLLEAVRDDERVWDLFKNGITCTLNQVDSDNGMQQAKTYGIHSFEEGALIAAAIRPSFDSWRDKFLHRESYTTGSEKLDEVLAQTNHYILFQENLMQYFQWLGVTPAESIGLIKKISKKKIKPDDFAKLEERIKKQWVANTGSEDMFDETWAMIQSCMAYGFAAPHAAATSLDMLYGAYLKVNYPYEYYTVCFNNYEGDHERTLKLKQELEYFGIKLSDIKFRNSKSEYTFNKKTQTIYKGMSSIKYLNKRLGREFYKLRNDHFDSFIDLLVVNQVKKIADTRQMDILIKLDFFSEFGNPNQLLKQVEIFNEYYGAKQLSKATMNKIIPHDYMILLCEKETEKKYVDVDWEGIVKYLCKATADIKTSIADRISYEAGCLGYIQITSPDFGPNYVYVLDMNPKFANKTIQVYVIKTGEIRKLKVKARTFNDNPIAIGDFIRIDLEADEGRWSKSSDGKWIQSKTEFETVLKKYGHIRR